MNDSIKKTILAILSAIVFFISTAAFIFVVLKGSDYDAIMAGIIAIWLFVIAFFGLYFFVRNIATGNTRKVLSILIFSVIFIVGAIFSIQSLYATQQPGLAAAGALFVFIIAGLFTIVGVVGIFSVIFRNK